MGIPSCRKLKDRVVAFGPMHFSVFANDEEDNINREMVKYSDNTKLFWLVKN